MPDEICTTSADASRAVRKEPRGRSQAAFGGALFVLTFVATAGMAWSFMPKETREGTQQQNADLLKRVEDLEKQLAAKKLPEANGPHATNATPDEIFLQTSPSVVKVMTFDATGSGQTQGSGFLVDDRGLVVTNCHVIQKAHSSYLLLPDNTRVKVKGVAAMSSAVDIAILQAAQRVPARPLELAPFEFPSVGTKVYALGNPLGLSNTLSEGLVSAHRDREKYPVIQTTAPISPGSSGGPLLRSDGKVCGVTTFVNKQGQNLNFAVPASHVVRLLTACKDESNLMSFPLANGFGFPETSSIMNDLANEQSQRPILEARPGDPMSYWVRGCWFKDRHEYAEAAHEFGQAVEIDPSSSLYRCFRGQAWFDFGDFEKAEQDFDQAIRLRPSDSMALTMRGKCWLRRHDADKALEDLNEAVRISPNFVTAYASRALAWSAKKQFEKAIADFEVSLKLGGSMASFPYRDFAWLLSTCPAQEYRDGERALLLAKIGADLTKWNCGPELNVLAAAYAEVGQFDQAMRYQTKALEDPLCLPIQHEYLQRLELYRQHMPFRDEG